MLTPKHVTEHTVCDGLKWITTIFHLYCMMTWQLPYATAFRYMQRLFSQPIAFQISSASIGLIITT